MTGFAQFRGQIHLGMDVAKDAIAVVTTVAII
jgi:hypothetical protein